MSIEEDQALLDRLADVAAAEALRYFRQPLTIEDKADHSPVTVADRAVEQAVRAILHQACPEDGLYGEEYGEAAGSSERLWVIDPIDGTRAFIAGRPLFGTLVALFEGGSPVLGLLSAPAAGDRWIGSTGGAPQTTLNGSPVFVRPCPGLAAARLATTSPALFGPGGSAAFAAIAATATDVLYGGDCHNYGLLAAGHLDLVIEEGLKPYDWAALVPVIQAAGGIVSDWNGRPLNLQSEGRVVAAGDHRVHREALAILSTAGA